MTTATVATFTVPITKIGSIPLTNLTLAAPLPPACSRLVGDLAPFAVISYTCTLAAVTAIFTNVAVVTVTPMVGDNFKE